jgi:cation transport ATPase
MPFLGSFRRVTPGRAWPRCNRGWPGESVPVEAGPGVQTYAGALIRRGAATAEVTATGARNKFGRTAEPVRTAHVVSSQQQAVHAERVQGICTPSHKRGQTLQ